MAGGLFFDIDADEVAQIAAGFDLSKMQIRAAYTRALQRTAQRMRTAASRGLKAKMGLKNASRIRKRVKVKRFKGGNKDATEFEIWFGQNDFLVSDFKGKPARTGDGMDFRGHRLKGAFWANLGGKMQVVRRVGDGRLPLELVTIPVQDEMNVFIEDEIFEAAADVFWKEFTREIKARAILGIGVK